ncbi:MAG: VOC family protein [Acidobacteriota bacterium]|nr:VOC family protein [Acidobacteriota bacterium]
MTDKPLILKVQHAQITIPKGAEDEARKFYCDFLGLKEIPKPESLQGRGGFWLEIGAFQVHVGTEDGFDRAKTKAHLAYEVEDLEGWRARLEETGVRILEGVPIPNYRRFEFRDPFGNRVEFLEAA